MPKDRTKRTVFKGGKKEGTKGPPKVALDVKKFLGVQFSAGGVAPRNDRENVTHGREHGKTATRMGKKSQRNLGG